MKLFWFVSAIFFVYTGAFNSTSAFDDRFIAGLIVGLLILLAMLVITYPKPNSSIQTINWHA